jgi:hypothetical protein
MEIQTWECVTCGKKFKVGQWQCEDGISNHTVANKEYLQNDSPAEPGHVSGTGMNSQRDGRTIICNMPPDKIVLRNGESALVPGGTVEFVRGRFSTSNPEVQYWLERKGGFCTEAQWAAAWLSNSQQLEIREMKLKAQENRLEQDRNSLLERVKSEKSGNQARV